MTNNGKTTTWHDIAGPLAVAVAALIAVVATLDAAGTYPRLAQGPGITLDESFNVQMGVYQWRVLCEDNLALLFPEIVQRDFGPASHYYPDHPPLGRLWLGMWHELTKWLFPPSNLPPPPHDLFVTVCARVGSATAFSLTVLLIGWFATKWHGRAAGLTAAVSLLLMPRVFAHAHLAALETCMNLSYAATILAVGHWWTKSLVLSGRGASRWFGVSWKVAALTGVLFGLALLTKIQAILIPPVIGLWALWHWRHRAVAPLLVFGLTGLAVFIVGWPWLWLDLTTNVREYFARTTSRATLNCYYLGRAWPDKDVPWHYPFAMFAVTVPIGLHVLGCVGCRASRHLGPLEAMPGTDPQSDARRRLLLLATLLPLVLFAAPGVAVYDGERLFLISFPMWAVLIGRGGDWAWRRLGRRAQQQSARSKNRISCGAVVAAVVASQAIGMITTHPCQLSYYNLLVGGSAGADRLGFERTYWGDSITRDFLKDVVKSVPEGSSLRVTPVLHQFQLGELLKQSPLLRSRNIRLHEPNFRNVPATDPMPVAEIVFARKADLPSPEWSTEAKDISASPHVGSPSRWLVRLKPLRPEAFAPVKKRE